MNSLKKAYQRALSMLNTRPRTGRAKIGALVGIELECEGTININLATFNRQLTWTLHDDRSLRNGGQEFVLRQPILMEEVKPALEEWNRLTRGSQFTDSIRTSVHVHVNVSDLKWSQILAGVAAWWILENPLVAYCGQHREGNLFCLRVKDSETQVTGLSKSVTGGEINGYCSNDHLKYGALNLYSIMRYGSLESRPMRGLYTIEEIEEWVEVSFNILRRTAERFPHPQAVLDHYLEVGPENFMNSIVGEQFANKLRNVMCEKTWLTTKSIDHNIPYVFELVSAIPNWDWVSETTSNVREPAYIFDNDPDLDEMNNDFETQDEPPFDEEEENVMIEERRAARDERQTMEQRQMEEQDIRRTLDALVRDTETRHYTRQRPISRPIAFAPGSTPTTFNLDTTTGNWTTIATRRGE